MRHDTYMNGPHSTRARAQYMCAARVHAHTKCVPVCYKVLQFVAVCCSVLQYVAVCCSMSQFVAVCLSQRSARTREKDKQRSARTREKDKQRSARTREKDNAHGEEAHRHRNMTQGLGGFLIERDVHYELSLNITHEKSKRSDTAVEGVRRLGERCQDALPAMACVPRSHINQPQI